MLKFFFSFCILFTAAFAFADSQQQSVSAPQECFDKLAECRSFGETELNELRAIMEAEKGTDKKVDCTFCPDALTWYLVENSFFDEAKWLIAHKADYGIKNEDGTALLHLVCKMGNQEMAEHLLDLGAEINLPDNKGLTAIHYAAMSGNSKLVEALLKRDSDPNKLTKTKETPLHFAAKYAGIEEVQFLVEHGASIKAINWTLVENIKEQRRRQDRLYYDSDEEHINALKAALGLKTPELLMDDEEEEEEEDEDEDDGGERYADVTASQFSPVRSKRNAGQKITDLDHIPVELLPRDIHDAANTEGTTALHYAAGRGDTDVVQYLIENGADIKAEDTAFSRSVIHFAAENGNIDCIKYLTENGANLLDRDCYGATALHYAARSNNLEAVKYLVNKKVDYTDKDIRGWTAMHYAASGGSIDVVKYLLAKGLNINARNKEKRTPLFFAKDYPELRKFMISNGAK